MAYPKLPAEGPAPALDGRVVLRKEATEDHQDVRQHMRRVFHPGALSALIFNVERGARLDCGFTGLRP